MSTPPLERVVIFGAGGGGRRVYRVLRATAAIVAFVDNDAVKHGTRLLGVPIIGAHQLATITWDRIVIASMAQEKIFAQLIEAGVPVGKIVIADRSTMLGEDDAPWGCWALLLVLAAAVATGWWLFSR